MDRVSILIYAQNPNETALSEICAGIEEEGVLYEVISKQIIDVKLSAHEAANVSRTGCGIAVLGSTAKFTLFNLDEIDIEFASYRQFGQNAARMVKRKPLIIGNSFEQL